MSLSQGDQHSLAMDGSELARVTFQPHRRLHAMCARGTSIVVMVQQNAFTCNTHPQAVHPWWWHPAGSWGGGVVTESVLQGKDITQVDMSTG